MATALENKALLPNYTASRNRPQETFVCECGRKCTSHADLQQHKLTICENRSLPCSFCQEIQSSSIALRAHLMQCGNKTDQCPICHKFIRRAVFTYHYENNCANLDDTETGPTPPTVPKTDRPSSRSRRRAVKSKDDDDTVSDHSKSSIQIPTRTSDTPSAQEITQCKYCSAPYVRSDEETHMKNCLQNPQTLTARPAQRSRRPLTESNQSKIPSARDERDLDVIPCERCNQPVKFSDWDIHSEECRQREKRRLKTLAKEINEKPINEQASCEHCGEHYPLRELSHHEMICQIKRRASGTTKFDRTTLLTNTDSPMRPSRIDTKSMFSTSSNLHASPSTSSMSGYTLPAAILDKTDSNMILKQRETPQSAYVSPHVTINSGRSRENPNPVIVQDEATARHKARRRSSSTSSKPILVNSDDIGNLRPSSNTSSLRGTSLIRPDRVQPLQSLDSSRGASQRPRSASIQCRDARGSYRPPAVRHGNISSREDSRFFSPRSADQCHQPQIKTSRSGQQSKKPPKGAVNHPKPWT